jgi:hypothetical protein
LHFSGEGSFGLRNGLTRLVFLSISTLAFVLQRFAAIWADSFDLGFKSLLVFGFGLTSINTVCSFK